MGNLCCGASDEVAPLLDERHREAAKRRGSASLSVSPATSRPSSRRTTPSRPPALLEPSSSPANDSARGPDVDDHHHHQHKRHHHHGDHDDHHQADDYVEVDTSKRRKHEQQKHHHHRHEKASLASLSVPSTLGSSASTLQHPTKSRPRGPLKRNPSRLHHLRVPDVGQDTLFLYQASTAPFQEKDEDEEPMINEVEVVQQQRRNGQEARMVPAGFDPADVRKQLKPTGAGGGRGRGMGLGGFDASAARANLRSVAKDAQ